MAQILKGAPVVAAMNEANAARCAALKEKGTSMEELLASLTK